MFGQRTDFLTTGTSCMKIRVPRHRLQLWSFKEGQVGGGKSYSVHTYVPLKHGSR